MTLQSLILPFPSFLTPNESGSGLQVLLWRVQVRLTKSKSLNYGLIFKGRLTLLTPEVVSAAAASEVKTGQRVGLGWDLRKVEYSQFGRQNFYHRIIPLPSSSGLGTCFDDAYSFNPRTRLYILLTVLKTDKQTEQSSQWDGFRHYSQPRNSDDPPSSQDRVFYGGTTKGEILDASNHRIGLQYWAPEGIAGEC